MIFEKHIWGSCFNLAFDNSFPEFLSFDGLIAFTFGFILKVQFFKLCTVAIWEARGFVWTKQGPITVFNDSFHEEIGDP